MNIRCSEFGILKNVFTMLVHGGVGSSGGSDARVVVVFEKKNWTFFTATNIRTAIRLGYERFV